MNVRCQGATGRKITFCVVGLVTKFLIQIFVFALISKFEIDLEPIKYFIFQTMKSFRKSNMLTMNITNDVSSNIKYDGNVHHR